MFSAYTSTARSRSRELIFQIFKSGRNSRANRSSRARPLVAAREIAPASLLNRWIGARAPTTHTEVIEGSEVVLFSRSEIRIGCVKILYSISENTALEIEAECWRSSIAGR